MLDDNDELVPPGAFLLNAERFDLIGEIDRWVISQAVSLLHEHARVGNDFSLSVNLSGKTMNDLDLAGDLGEMLKKRPIPPGRLVVEVTETAAIVNIERARELAQQLRQIGCLFALDDFGSGFSSFYYLKHLRVRLPQDRRRVHHEARQHRDRPAAGAGGGRASRAGSGRRPSPSSLATRRP